MDIRYFLIAVGNRGSSVNQNSINGRKVVFIDDLEIPSKKGQNIDQLYYALAKNNGATVLEQLKQNLIAYRTRNISSFLMLQEFEHRLGIVKAFRYYWAFSVNCSPSESNEMNKELKKSLRKMAYKDKECVLATNESYYDILYSICLLLTTFLQENKERIQPITEVRLNALISSYHGYTIGHLLQARPLPHLVSTTSLNALRPLLFSSGEAMQAAFRSTDIDDMVVMLVLYEVALAKCIDSLSTPGFRGIEWLRDKVRDFDLSWLPIAKKDRLPTGDGKEFNTPGEEFPSIIHKKPNEGEVNIQEQMNFQAVENKKKLQTKGNHEYQWNNFHNGGITANFSNGVYLGSQHPNLPFPFKIPLMDTSKPFSKIIMVSTLPVGSYQPTIVKNLEDTSVKDTLDYTDEQEQEIKNDVVIFKKNKKKK